MLRLLSIRNFVVVEALDLELGDAFTVLTGETGAGKSIVVDALMLVCGARAAADQIRAGADKAEIAATFDIRQAPPGLRAKRARKSRSIALARSVIFAVTGRMCGRASPSVATTTTVKMMLCMKPSFSTVQMPKMAAAMIAP